MKSNTDDKFICRQVLHVTTIKELLDEWKIVTKAPGNFYEVRNDKNVLLSLHHCVKDIASMDPMAPFIHLKVIDLSQKGDGEMFYF